MNVLSLFGGIETGLIALKELGIKVDNYYSSEIDKYASAVARFNHPKIIELGDISNYETWNLPKIDLILAGPPCQGFSIAGKGLNWDDPRSQLFFTAIEILWKYKPKYFLFENVASMKKEIRTEIDELMEVDHIMINSALVSAQNRKRNYWCNWYVEQPEDKGILLKDIIEGGVVDRDKSLTMTSTYRFNPQLYEYTKQKRKQIVFVIGKINSSQDGKIVSTNGKILTLTASKANCLKIGNVNPSGRGMNGDIKSIKSEKMNALTTNKGEGYKIGDYFENSIRYRKLTSLECERLQTLSENYTQTGINKVGAQVKISNSQRYKMIGNCWTKDVVKYILRGIL